jgi:hypothetical protein
MDNVRPRSVSFAAFSFSPVLTQDHLDIFLTLSLSLLCPSSGIIATFIGIKAIDFGLGLFI